MKKINIQYRVILDENNYVIGVGLNPSANSFPVQKAVFDTIRQCPDRVYKYCAGSLIRDVQKEIEKQNAKKQKEAERKAKLHITKYDFYQYVCKPCGISYALLTDFVNSSDEIKAAFELCNHIYRGNTVFIDAIKQFAPSITDEQLDLIFEQYSAKE